MEVFLSFFFYNYFFEISFHSVCLVIVFVYKTKAIFQQKKKENLFY